MHGLRNVAVKVFVDFLCLFIVFLPWIILQAVNTPYRRGFYCDDTSIRYPFLENTVSSGLLTACGFAIGLVLVLAVECATYFVDTKNRESPLQLTSTLSIPYLIVLIYKFYGVYLFGMAVQQTIVNIGKYSIGRLRPHFFSLCNPNVNCTGEMFQYIMDYQCQDETGKKAVDSRLSFPSGHSSLAAYCAVYLVMYLQSRMSWNRCKMVRHMIQALLVYGAFYVCLSRISDYKHHPTDVLSGAFIGVFIAALVGVHMAEFLNFQNILLRTGYFGPNSETALNTRGARMGGSDELEEPIGILIWPSSHAFRTTKKQERS